MSPCTPWSIPKIAPSSRMSKLPRLPQKGPNSGNLVKKVRPRGVCVKITCKDHKRAVTREPTPVCVEDHAVKHSKKAQVPHALLGDVQVAYKNGVRRLFEPRFNFAEKGRGVEWRIIDFTLILDELHHQYSFGHKGGPYVPSGRNKREGSGRPLWLRCRGCRLSWSSFFTALVHHVSYERSSGDATAIIADIIRAYSTLLSMTSRHSGTLT